MMGLEKSAAVIGIAIRIGQRIPEAILFMASVALAVGYYLTGHVLFGALAVVLAVLLVTLIFRLGG